MKDGGVMSAEILVKGDEGWPKSKLQIGGYCRFDLLDDAQRVLTFQLKELGTLPEGTKYSHTRVLQAKDGTYLGDATLVYEDTMPDKYGFVSAFSFSQRYVGPNASIEITADYAKGAQLSTAVTVNGNTGIYEEITGLSWIQDGVYFELNGLPLEEALSVAKSIK
jgi:hypothetical protein